jgi:hypothetical protein
LIDDAGAVGEDGFARKIAVNVAAEVRGGIGNGVRVLSRALRAMVSTSPRRVLFIVLSLVGCCSRIMRVAWCMATLVRS